MSVCVRVVRGGVEQYFSTSCSGWFSRQGRAYCILYLKAKFMPGVSLIAGKSNYGNKFYIGMLGS